VKTTTALDPETAGHFKTLEARIREGDGQGIAARWAFGRAVLAERVGKQLPKGRLDQIAKAAGVGRAEVVARAALAARYPTESKVADAVKKFPTWHTMVHEGLAARKPRIKPDPAMAKLTREERAAKRRAKDFVESLEYATIDLSDAYQFGQFDLDFSSYERTQTFKKTMGTVLTAEQRADAITDLKRVKESAENILDFMTGSDPDEAKARKLEMWIARAKVGHATDGEIASATAIVGQLRGKTNGHANGHEANGDANAIARQRQAEYDGAHARPSATTPRSQPA
jgi:hypothetical protein